MTAAWIALLVLGVPLACIILATGLAWVIGNIPAWTQKRRERPDFRQRGRGRKS